MTAADPLPCGPRRILVTGCSGSGKTTLATALATRLGLPHHELDALFHGPGWVPRLMFVADVTALAATESWVVEWQYEQVRSLLLTRADLLVWLDLSGTRVFAQLLSRTVCWLSSRSTIPGRRAAAEPSGDPALAGALGVIATIPTFPGSITADVVLDVRRAPQHPPEPRR